MSLSVLLTVAHAVTGLGLVQFRDYRGKGQIRVRLQPDQPVKAGETPNELHCSIEQVFLGPDRALLSADWLGLRQQMLAQGSVEQVYRPTMGMIIERRYLNLSSTDENPSLALQTSMAEAGRLLREAQSARALGNEKVLDYDCDVVEASSKEILEKMGDLLSPGKNRALLGGKVKAWIVRQFGVPVKLEIYTAAGNLAAALTMEELKFNTGVKPEEMKLDAPAGTKKVSIDVDVTEMGWQRKMEQALRQAVAAVADPPRP
jgi:outer membrane lipoprotein-sorting protein